MLYDSIEMQRLYDTAKNCEAKVLRSANELLALAKLGERCKSGKCRNAQASKERTKPCHSATRRKDR